MGSRLRGLAQDDGHIVIPPNVGDLQIETLKHVFGGGGLYPSPLPGRLANPARSGDQEIVGEQRLQGTPIASPERFEELPLDLFELLHRSDRNESALGESTVAWASVPE